MELLLLSSSRTPAGYFTDYLPEIRDFTRGVQRAVFIPFAAVGLPSDKYAGRVRKATGLALEVVDRKIGDADLIVVGGGNTFQLLRECRHRGLLSQMARSVRSGTKYLGWSAGANLACPSIRTTNDMPIVDPGGLDALGLLPFQINPHYLSVALPGHHGETRDQRLAEFARVNPDLPVLGLPEGNWLRVSGHRVALGGPHAAIGFQGKRRFSATSGRFSVLMRRVKKR
jgi:dipeptidase E